jgi:hypothetical protein
MTAARHPLVTGFAPGVPTDAQRTAEAGKRDHCFHLPSTSVAQQPHVSQRG